MPVTRRPATSCKGHLASSFRTLSSGASGSKVRRPIFRSRAQGRAMPAVMSVSTKYGTVDTVDEEEESGEEDDEDDEEFGRGRSTTPW